MNNVTIKFQNPFEAHLSIINFINKEQTIKAFEAINWEQLNLDIYEKHDDVIHDYYFFEVSYIDPATFEHAINLSGLYTHGENLDRNGPQFYLRYRRPKEQTSRGFLGLGALKTKTISATLEMDDCNKPFALECLKAFLNHNTTFLENEIVNHISFNS